MTKNDKELIYNLLKISSKAVYGYTTDAFSAGEPVFSDDAETQPENHSDTVVQVADASSSLNPADNKKSSISLNSIAERIRQCNRCKLCSGRTNTVPGTGVENPLVLVIGEGPGYEEDQQGLPFVGAAGQLLDKMLSAISLSRRQNCYIANIVKCRPPHNRDPEPDEIQACISYLDAQITLLKPKMILLMGRIASQSILRTSAGINSIRGNFYQYNGIPVMATYHPSALLRNVDLKAPAWQDLKKFRAELLKLSPDYEKNFVKE